MKVRSLSVENFRKFRDLMLLDGFADGLNLVCEANEAGKSTVLEAMRAALFERHNSSSQRIRDFRPHDDDVAPFVELAFEVDGAPWTVRKRFLRRPEARLTGPSGERLDGDAAEERLQTLLGFSRPKSTGADEQSRGALGLFWVEQGAAFGLAPPGLSARRTLQDVLSAEVGAVTGGKRAPAVLARVTEELEQLQTKTGASRGPLKTAELNRDAAEGELQIAEAELRRFGDTLDQLQGKRGELRRLEQELADRDPAGEEAALTADLARAQQALAGWEAVKAQADAARLRRDAAQARMERRANERRDLEQSQAALSAAERTVSEYRASVDFAEAEAHLAAEQLDVARQEESAAGERRDLAAAARDAGERSRVLIAAFERLKAAERLEVEIKALQSALDANPVTESALEELDQLDRAMTSARATFEAGATGLDLELAPAARSRVTVGGRPVAAASLQLTEPTRIEIEGLGALVIRPPAGTAASSRATLDSARADLIDALSRWACADVDAARALGAERRLVVTDVELARRALAFSCRADPSLPSAGGLPELRTALSGEAQPGAESGDALALKAAADGAEAEYRMVRIQLDEAVERREAAAGRLRKAETEHERRVAAHAQALAERGRRAAALASATPDDQALVAEAERLALEAARLKVDSEEAERTARTLDPAAAERRLGTHRRHLQRLGEDRQLLAVDIARLEETAKTQGGTGPATRTEAAREALALDAADVERLTEEAAVLRLLKDTLDAATADASRRYLAPVVSRVDPFVRRLIPSASLSFGEDLRPLGLTREGRTEDAQRLSKGTQEQLAVLTRLAFAQLIVDKGRPASVILDDALVYSDDARFETMLDILAESAERLQIIVLTCRASLFRRMDAKRLGLCA